MKYYVIERDSRMAENGKLGSRVVWASEPYQDDKVAYEVADVLNKEYEEQHGSAIIQIFKLDPWSALKVFEVHAVSKPWEGSANSHGI